MRIPWLVIGILVGAVLAIAVPLPPAVYDLFVAGNDDVGMHLAVPLTIYCGAGLLVGLLLDMFMPKEKQVS